MLQQLRFPCYCLPHSFAFVNTASKKKSAFSKAVVAFAPKHSMYKKYCKGKFQSLLLRAASLNG